MNVLHDMIPNFYDFSNKGNKNCDILGNQNGDCLFCHHTKSKKGCYVASVRM